VIGLPGDNIRIRRGQRVLINGQLLEESSYVKDAPNYNSNTLGDIGGRRIRPYGDPGNLNAAKPIVVPPGQLFVLADNRNDGEDSHVWGMLGDDRVIGRPLIKFDPTLEIVQLPRYGTK